VTDFSAVAFLAARGLRVATVVSSVNFVCFERGAAGVVPALAVLLRALGGALVVLAGGLALAVLVVFFTVVFLLTGVREVAITTPFLK
jgi:hypothetical protein